MTDPLAQPLTDDLFDALKDLLADIDSMEEIPPAISGTSLCVARQAVDRAQAAKAGRAA